MMRVLTIAALGVLFVGGAFGVHAQEAAKARVINGGVLNGKATNLPKPDYPIHLKEQGIGGTVVVEVEIDEAGIVVSAAAVKPASAPAGSDAVAGAERSGIDPALVEAAESAARAAQFAPTTLNQVPIRVKGTLVYRFAKSNEASDDGQKSVSGGVLNGKATSLPMPGYPPAAKAVKAEGAVSVSVVIDESGNVVEAEAISGHPLLRSAAAEAAREAKFSPTMLSGSPVRVKGVLVYNFVL